MKVMDIESENLGIPDAEYQAIVRMPSAEFTRICNDLATFGDTVVISVTGDGVRFSTRGDIGSANVVPIAVHMVLCFGRQVSILYECFYTCIIGILMLYICLQPEEVTIIEMNEPVTLTFALRYMNSFTKAAPLSGTVTLSLAPDHPMAVEYEIPELGYIRFYLAPKLDEDQEA
ncbi:Proliferating cell nuclear antigen [Linum grandiflorum]